METADRACASGGAMKRRDLLKAAPAALVLGTVPALAADPQTPIMALFREWQAAQEAEDAAYVADLPDEEVEPIANNRRSIEEAMMATPCEDARDWVCKVTAYTAFGVFTLQEAEEAPALWAEARALVARA